MAKKCLDVWSGHRVHLGTGLQVTPDSGNTWQPLGSPDHLDVRSLATDKNQIWVAGSPASRFFYSRDMGGSWQSLITPATLPIHRLRFFAHANRDETLDSGNQLWAVGSRGIILASKDGGETWKRKRGGSERIALLGLFADERSIPWDLVSQASASDGWRVHCVVLAGRHRDETLRCELEKRLQTAAMHVGATAEVLTRLPWPDGVDVPAGELVGQWQGDDRDIMNLLPRKLTMLLRTWRPDVVVTSGISDGKLDQPTGAQRLLAQLIGDAREYAAMPEVFPEQISVLGLQPWTVSRQLDVRHVKGTVPSLDTVPSVRGGSVAGLAEHAERLVGTPNYVGRSWSLFSSTDGDVRNFGRYPLGGIVANFGSAQRRERTITEDPASRTRLLQRAARTRRIVENERLIGDGQARLEQIERLVEDRNEAATLLFELATRRDSEESQKILQHLVKRHADHALTEAALDRLVRVHTSAERMWLAYRAVQNDANQEIVDPNLRLATAELNVSGAPASNLTPLSDVPNALQVPDRVTEIATANASGAIENDAVASSTSAEPSRG